MEPMDIVGKAKEDASLPKGVFFFCFPYPISCRYCLGFSLFLCQKVKPRLYPNLLRNIFPPKFHCGVRR